MATVIPQTATVEAHPVQPYVIDSERKVHRVCHLMGLSLSSQVTREQSGAYASEIRDLRAYLGTPPGQPSHMKRVRVLQKIFAAHVIKIAFAVGASRGVYGRAFLRDRQDPAYANHSWSRIHLGYMDGYLICLGGCGGTELHMHSGEVRRFGNCLGDIDIVPLAEVCYAVVGGDEMPVRLALDIPRAYVREHRQELLDEGNIRRFRDLIATAAQAAMRFIRMQYRSKVDEGIPPAIARGDLEEEDVIDLTGSGDSLSVCMQAMTIRTLDHLPCPGAPRLCPQGDVVSRFSTAPDLPGPAPSGVPLPAALALDAPLYDPERDSLGAVMQPPTRVESPRTEDGAGAGSGPVLVHLMASSVEGEAMQPPVLAPVPPGEGEGVHLLLLAAAAATHTQQEQG